MFLSPLAKRQNSTLKYWQLYRIQLEMEFLASFQYGARSSRFRGGSFMVGHTYQTANVQNSPHQNIAHQNIAPFDHDFMAGHRYQTANHPV